MEMTSNRRSATLWTESRPSLDVKTVCFSSVAIQVSWSIFGCNSDKSNPILFVCRIRFNVFLKIQKREFYCVDRKTKLFSSFMRQYLENGKRYEKLLLMTNRKLHNGLSIGTKVNDLK